MNAIPSARGFQGVGPRLTLGILVLLAALSQVDRGILGLVVQPVSAHFGINDFQISLLQGAAFAIFYAVLGLPFGVVADRWSRRGLIFIGVAIWSLAAAGCGLAASFNQLVLARLLVGAGEAALYPAALSLISDIFPRHRLASAVSVFSIGSSIGAGVSLGFGGVLVDLFTKTPVSLPLVGPVEAWQAVFVATGAPGLLLAPLILLAPEPRRGATAAPPAPWRPLFAFMHSRRHFFIRHFTAFSLLSLLAMGNGAWMPALMMRRFGFTPGQAGIAFGLMAAVTNTVGMLAAGALLDRLIRRGVSDAPMRLFVWLTPVAAAFAIVGSLSPSPVVFLTCMAVAQFGYSLSGPAATAIQLVAPATMRGRLSALFNVVFYLVGYGFGPSVVALLTTYLYRDPNAVHLSIATTMAVIAPIAWLVMLSGLKPMREAMALGEAQRDA